MASSEDKTIRQYFYEKTDKQTRDTYDLMYVNKIAERFLDANELYTDLNDNIDEQAKEIGLSKRDIPRPSVSVYNKIIEVYREYKNVGLSIAASPLIDPMIHQLTQKMTESQDIIEDYNKAFSSIINKRIGQYLDKPKKSPLTKFFSKVKSFFASLSEVQSPAYSQEEKDLLEGKLDEYENKDREIQEYRIDKDLIPYITEDISQYEDAHEAVAAVSEIEEELIALGYTECIPKMEETIRNAFLNRLSEQERNNINPEDLHNFVPDFSAMKEKTHSTQENRQANNDTKTEIDVSDDTENR